MEQVVKQFNYYRNLTDKNNKKLETQIMEYARENNLYIQQISLSMNNSGTTQKALVLFEKKIKKKSLT